MLQAVRQTVKGLEFTILLGRMFTGIFGSVHRTVVKRRSRRKPVGHFSLE